MSQDMSDEKFLEDMETILGREPTGCMECMRSFDNDEVQRRMDNRANVAKIETGNAKDITVGMYERLRQWIRGEE